MTVTSRRLFAWLVVFTLVIAACGDDDDGAAETSTEAPTATEAPSATEPAAAPTTAAPSDNGGGDGVDLGGLFTGQCEEAVLGVAAAMSAYSTGLAQAFSGALDEAEIEASADELRQFADDAPDELRDDLDVMAAALAEFAQAYLDSGFDPTSGEPPTPEQIEQLSQLADQFDDSRFEEAADNIEAWFEDNCN